MRLPFGSIVDGTPTGYDVDVARLLATDLGARLELVAVTSPNRIATLLTQRVDLIVANLGITPERAKAISFSTPYAPFFSAVFGAPDLAVKGPADLQGRKIALTRDTIIDELWGESPPPTAAKVLQNCISALRKELPDGGAALRTVGGAHRGACSGSQTRGVPGAGAGGSGGPAPGWLVRPSAGPPGEGLSTGSCGW